MICIMRRAIIMIPHPIDTVANKDVGATQGYAATATSILFRPLNTTLPPA